MVPSAKGKEKVIDGKASKSAEKRKRNATSDGAARKRNRSVLQFFEDAADVDDDNASDDSLFGDDFLEDQFGSGGASGSKEPDEVAKAPFVPFVPKEEQITEEEFDKILEQRYKPGSSLVTYAEDNYESKRSVETSTYIPPAFAVDPVVWKVKCMVGRERHSAFCLMQKYVDLKYLGTKLKIISAFALDHVKGFFYIEAEKQSDIYEACNGLCNIYSSRVTRVPKDEISHLFSVRSKGNGISVGMWARVKSGTYKGDLAQVVAVNNPRKKVTVKLIPRIDLQAMAEKFGRGITPHRAAPPAPRLISSSELEEFRPLIQYRRDRDTNKMFEILDGMMLKDGYLYKKVSMDSLNFWGVTPTEDELLKFEPSNNDECNDLEWLSQLYGERKKKRPVISGKGGGKGEGSSSFGMENKFEVHDLVFFGRKDFGVVIGSEKDDSFKIIKEGSEGPVTVTVRVRELKSAEFDKKLFTALDQQLKNISVNDTVRVLDGPLKDKQGVVKKIYGGIVFLYNETEEENNGYICTKARFCEKVEPSGGACNEKSGEPGSSGFGDIFSSSRSPLSPEQPQQEKGGSFKFNRDDNAMFSIGQSLRIRVGPLKGYLCRVLAVRRSDVTVKLDSQHKILTVKPEHLSEVKSTGVSTGVEIDSAKSFGLLGAEDGSREWMDGAAAAAAAEGGSWNSGGFSTERSSWPAFPASNSSEPALSVPPNSVDEDANKGDSSWEVKATPSQVSSWGAAGATHETVAATEQVAGWGSQKKDASSSGFGDGASDSWGKAVESRHQTTDEGLKDDSWGRAAGNASCNDDSNRNNSAWNGSGSSPEKQNAGWGPAQSSGQPEGSAWNKSTTVSEVQTNSWGNMKKDGDNSGGWGKKVSTWDKDVENEEKGSSGENKKDTWGMSTDKWGKKDSFTGNTIGVDGQSRGWKKTAEVAHDSSPWNKQDGESSWSKQNIGGAGSSWGRQDDASASWSKPDGGSSSWPKPKQDGGSSSWVKQDGESSWAKQDGESSWYKGDGGASWNSSSGMGNRHDTDQQESWGRPKAFDGGCGSGGRRGRGGGRGGRDQFGRGRSFDQAQSTNWRSDGKGEDDLPCGWGKEPGGSWGEKSDWGNKSSNWQNSRSTQDNMSLSWNRSSVTNDEDAKAVDGAGSWEKRETAVEDSKSPWESSTTFKNQSSAWGGKTDWGTQKVCLGNNGDADDVGGGWNSKKSSDGGLSSSWGQNINTGDATNAGSGWNSKKSSEGGSSSGWGKSNNTGDADNVGAGWSSKKYSEGGSSSGWGQNNNSGNADNEGGGRNSNKSFEGGLSSRWGQNNDSGNADNGGGGWNSKKSFEGGSTSGWGQNKDSGNADNGGGGWNSKKSFEGGSSSGWARSNNTGDAENVGACWNSKKSSERGSSSGWGQNSDSGNADNGVGGWNSKKSSEGGSSSGWGQSNNTGDATNDGNGLNSKKSSEGGSSSGWGQSNNSGDAAKNSGGWNSKKSSGGGSSSGWGQGKWAGTSDAGGNQGSWGSKSNWNSENNFGRSEEQTDTFGDKGRDGGWRGGRGGRWGSDGGRFGSRGGSDRGGFRGRGRSDRGGFGGRGRSDGGGFGGRGGSESGGFRGRGGFGGRGRGRRDDWNNKTESGEDKPYSWNNSNKDSSWSSDNSGGNWNHGASGKSQWQSESSGWHSEGAAGGGDRAQAGGWNKAIGWGNDDGSNAKAGGPDGKDGSWRSSNSSGGNTSSAWNQPPANRGEGADIAAGSSWGQPSNESSKGSSWGQPSGGSGKGGSWGQPGNESSKGNSWGQPRGGNGKDGRPLNGNSGDGASGQPSNDSEQGGAGDQPSSGNGKGSLWGQPSGGSGKSNSWDQSGEGSGKGGW